MATAKINGIWTYYEIRGKGTPLVMVMGWTANKDWWIEDFLKYLEKHFKLILFDNRGSGRTESSNGFYSIQQFANDIIDLMDYLNIEKFDVFGVSMGGMIVQELVINHPLRINKLILGCTNCGLKHSKLTSVDSVIYGVFCIIKYMRDFDKCLASILLSRTDLTDDDIYLINCYKIAPSKTIDIIKQFIAILHFDTFDRLKEITCPTLIMSGTHDLLIPHVNSNLLYKNIPHAKLFKMQGLGHGFIRDASADVFLAIFKFLK